MLYIFDHKVRTMMDYHVGLITLYTSRMGNGTIFGMLIKIIAVRLVISSKS